ncbi:hypothetical protein MOBUDSM44075_04325 [Mycolicibacterium obuense]|uniref:Uncharacterized protein n=1 Tax=Mycolicibacterium obuense TaxID=1807 RepID=A0A0J6VD24_9MYCO|nr:hypothetical protein MOBUDSM44075_04325 [Mycolicibacterium obuense]
MAYVDTDTWPLEAQQAIERLRAECAKHRMDRNKARRERDAAQAELAALRAALTSE